MKRYLLILVLVRLVVLKQDQELEQKLLLGNVHVQVREKLLEVNQSKVVVLLKVFHQNHLILDGQPLYRECWMVLVVVQDQIRIILAKLEVLSQFQLYLEVK